MIDHALLVALVLPPAYLAAELRRQDLVARALAARWGAGERGPGRRGAAPSVRRRDPFGPGAEARAVAAAEELIRRHQRGDRR
jgi:hypothetical protein